MYDRGFIILFSHSSAGLQEKIKNKKTLSRFGWGFCFCGIGQG